MSDSQQLWIDYTFIDILRWNGHFQIPFTDWYKYLVPALLHSNVFTIKPVVKVAGCKNEDLSLSAW